MTKEQKAAQNSGSRFIRIIASQDYANYRASGEANNYKYDNQGRRTK